MSGAERRVRRTRIEALVGRYHRLEDERAVPVHLGVLRRREVEHAPVLGPDDGRLHGVPGPDDQRLLGVLGPDDDRPQGVLAWTRRSASAVGPWTRRRPCAAGLTRRDSRRGPSDRAAGRDARACSAPAADLEINVTSTSYSLVHIARSKLNSSCSKHRKPT